MVNLAGIMRLGNLIRDQIRGLWVSACGSGSEREMGAPRGRKAPRVGVCTQAQSKRFTSQHRREGGFGVRWCWGRIWGVNSCPSCCLWGQGVAALAPLGLSITPALTTASPWALSGGDKSMSPALGRAPRPSLGGFRAGNSLDPHAAAMSSLQAAPFLSNSCYWCHWATRTASAPGGHAPLGRGPVTPAPAPGAGGRSPLTKG